MSSIASTPAVASSAATSAPAPPAHPRPATAPPVPRESAARRYDIDALRLLALALLLLYHSSRPFDAEAWHVKSDALSPTLQLLGGLVTPWRLPLLFVLAGMGTCFALGVRSARAYLRERSWRLLVPLLFGMAVVVPPQVYVERIATWMPNRLSPRDFDGSFLEFYPRSFTEGMYPSGNLSWHHLWFVAYLFVFSVVALPLFLWLRTPAGRRAVERLGGVLARGPLVVLLGLPLVAVDVALRGRFPTFQTLIGDWANVSHSLLLFVFGYLIAADDRLGLAIMRHRRRALGLALILTGVRLGYGMLGGERPAPYTGTYVLLTTLRTGVEWFWLLALLGYGRAHLDVPSRLLRSACELVYPFYILHQTVIVVVAFYVLSWPIGVASQYAAIVLLSLAATALLCVLVAHVPVARPLFGLKVRRAGGRPATRLQAADATTAPCSRSLDTSSRSLSAR